MLKDLVGLFILVLLLSAPVLAEEREPFIAGGVTFLDKHEVLSVEMGAEVLPNINWSLGFNAPIDSGEQEHFGTHCREASLGITYCVGLRNSRERCVGDNAAYRVELQQCRD